MDALALELTPQEAQRMGGPGTDNVAAHDAYLLGLTFYYRRTPKDNATAATHFTQAISLDPSYAEAHTALAKIYWQAGRGDSSYSEKLGINEYAGFARTWKSLEKGGARPNAGLLVALELTPQEAQRMGGPGTDNVAAHDAYLLGLTFYYRRTPKDNATAATHFTQAISLDPSYAEAHTALAKIYWQAGRGDSSYSEKLGINEYAGFARTWKSLEKGGARPNADFHVLRSWLALVRYQWDWAIAEVERALELSPNDADALEALAGALIYAGRPKEGIEVAERAMRQNPTLLARPLYLMGLGEFARGNTEKTVEHVERAVRLAPKIPEFLGILAVAYGELGRINQAMAAYQTYSEGFPDWSRLEIVVSRHPFSDPGVLDRLA